jgi:hypothetical protein
MSGLFIGITGLPANGLRYQPGAGLENNITGKVTFE